MASSFTLGNAFFKVFLNIGVRTGGGRNNLVTFTRDSGCQARDEFLIDRCQIASAIGLKVKKWLTNFQFELREES